MGVPRTKKPSVSEVRRRLLTKTGVSEEVLKLLEDSTKYYKRTRAREKQSRKPSSKETLKAIQEVLSLSNQLASALKRLDAIDRFDSRIPDFRRLTVIHELEGYKQKSHSRWSKDDDDGLIGLLKLAKSEMSKTVQRGAPSDLNTKLWAYEMKRLLEKNDVKVNQSIFTAILDHLSDVDFGPSKPSQLAKEILESYLEKKL